MKDVGRSIEAKAVSVLCTDPEGRQQKISEITQVRNGEERVHFILNN